ncbi:MAG: hypothetical protein K0Q49_1678 [Haloplasmataceae bacterium]|jgi:hypothetical protein|nr:hypothetical protein [Haloplasmataceae bacterium]
MKVYDYNDQYKIYFSAKDRIVKKTHDHVYEVYHITIGDDNLNMLSISTVDFNGLATDEIKESLEEIGLVYKSEEAKIVQKLNESEIVTKDKKVIDYVLADRLSISGHNYDTIKFEFENTNQLNELLLEHDIPIRYEKDTIAYL